MSCAQLFLHISPWFSSIAIFWLGLAYVPRSTSSTSDNSEINNRKTLGLARAISELAWLLTSGLTEQSIDRSGCLPRTFRHITCLITKKAIERIYPQRGGVLRTIDLSKQSMNWSGCLPRAFQPVASFITDFVAL